MSFVWLTFFLMVKFMHLLIFDVCPCLPSLMNISTINIQPLSKDKISFLEQSYNRNNFMHYPKKENIALWFSEERG